MLRVSSTSATSPVARVRYHSGVDEVTTMAAGGSLRAASRAAAIPVTRPGRGRSASQRWSDGPVLADQAGGQARRLQPGQRAASPRMIAAVLAVLASTQLPGGHADRAPARNGGLAGGRVDDVMHAPAAHGPGAHRGARGGQPAGPDRHRLPGRVRPGRVIVGDPHPPAVGRRRPGHRDVPAQADQTTPDPVLAAMQLGAAVRRPCFGRRAPGRAGPRSMSCASRRSRSSRTLRPAGHAGVRGPRPRRPRARRLEHREVTVVPDLLQRLPAGRVHVAVGEPRRAQRGLHQLGEQVADADGRAAGRVQPGQLGVGPEPAAGQVHGGQFGVGDGARVRPAAQAR